MLGQVPGVPVLPGRHRRLEGGVARRDALRKDRGDGGPVHGQQRANDHGTDSIVSVTRWATFDCYGTLIDWNAGIGGVLERLFGAERTPDLLARYHRLEPEVQAETYRSYAEVLTLTLERLVSETGLSIPEGESGALLHSLPEWPPFREVPGVLAELRSAAGISPSSPIPITR